MNDSATLVGATNGTFPDISELPEFPRKNLLSPREAEVLVGIVHALPSKEIAYLLKISVRTVENYRSQIFKKMGIKNGTGFSGTIRLIRIVYMLDARPTAPTVP